MGTVIIGVICCALLGFPSQALPFLILYVVAAVMLNGSMVFYDAFLVDAAESDDRLDMVSSHGYAWGYIGSCLPFIASLVIVLFGSNFGIDMSTGMKIAFLITAVWWFVFSLPLVRRVA